MGNKLGCGKKDGPEKTTITKQSSEHKGFRHGLVSRNLDTSVWEIYEKAQEKPLGTGMTGAVYLVRHRGTKELYALKSIDKFKMNEDLLDDLRNEIELLGVLDHPNVIKLYEYYEETRNLYLVLEYCSGLELYDRLHMQQQNKYTEAKAAELVTMMLHAISYCHGMNVSHRDLKLENFIFESMDEDSNLKLIDFGLSKKYGNISRMRTRVGTPYYIAPEVLSGGNYTQSCDLWSIGVITYMLLSGTPPFRGSDSEILAGVRRGKFDMEGRRWVKISPLAKDFIKALLVTNPKKRLTAKKALEHGWIRATRAQELSTPLDAEVLENMQEFREFSSVKRAALEAIAFTMNAKQIQKLRKAFIKLDKNETGFLTLEEIAPVLKEHGISEEDAVGIFLAADRDGQQRISYSEFLAATLSRRFYLSEEKMREAFRRLDVDHTGYITKKNLKTVLGDDFTDEKVEAMIREADEKADGKIDFEEFCKMIRSEGKVVVNRVERSDTMSSDTGRHLETKTAEDNAPDSKPGGSVDEKSSQGVSSTGEAPGPTSTTAAPSAAVAAGPATTSGGGADRG